MRPYVAMLKDASETPGEIKVLNRMTAPLEPFCLLLLRWRPTFELTDVRTAKQLVREHGLRGGRPEEAQLTAAGQRAAAGSANTQAQPRPAAGAAKRQAGQKAKSKAVPAKAKAKAKMIPWGGKRTKVGNAGVRVEVKEKGHDHQMKPRPPKK